MQPITHFRLWYKEHERAKRTITIITVIISIRTPKMLQHRQIIKTQLKVIPPKRDNNINQSRSSDMMEAKVAADTTEADPVAMAEVDMAAEAMATAVTAADMVEVDTAAGDTAAEIQVVAVSQHGGAVQVLAGAKDV